MPFQLTTDGWSRSGPPDGSATCRAARCIPRCASRTARSTGRRARFRSGCTGRPERMTHRRRWWCSSTAAAGSSAISTPTTATAASTRSARTRWWCRWTTGWRPSIPTPPRSRTCGPRRSGSPSTPPNSAPTRDRLAVAGRLRGRQPRRGGRAAGPRRRRAADCGSSCCGTRRPPGTPRCRRSPRTPTPRSWTSRRRRRSPAGTPAHVDLTDPPATLVPARAENLAGLPPAYIAVAGHDPLRDDGVRYGELLAAAGVPVEVHNAETLVHGYVGYAGVVPAATEAARTRPRPPCGRRCTPARRRRGSHGDRAHVGARRPQHRLPVIVGAGFSGIGTAIKLDKAGLGDYLVIEAGDGPGGTWHWNTYPGIAVDIPSFSYQFSFEQSPNWTRSYAPGRRAEGLRRALRRQVRPAPQDPIQHQGARSEVRRGRQPVARRPRRPASR